MKVIIRADASTVIGSGHVMRCLTLGRRLQKEQGAEVVFVMRDLSGNLMNLAEREGFCVLALPGTEKYTLLDGYEQWLTVPVEQDAKETLALVQKHFCTVDRIVVDNYALDYRWESLLRSVAKEIMVIDDLANRKHDCDILLDQNFYLDMDSRYQGLVPEHCRMFLGPEHALLREEFYEARKNLRQRDGQIRNILVFYGGSDLTDETSKAVQALLLLYEEYEAFSVDVITGQSNPHREKVAALCSRYDFINYYCQVENMAEFMNKADLMLGAGGSTTWERLFLQLPAIVTAVAENQVHVCEDCSAAGIIEYLGTAENVTIQMLVKAVKNKICKYSGLGTTKYREKDIFTI